MSLFDILKQLMNASDNVNEVMQLVVATSES